MATNMKTLRENFTLEELDKVEKQIREYIRMHAWTTGMVRDIGQTKGTLWIEVKPFKKEVLGETP